MNAFTNHNRELLIQQKLFLQNIIKEGRGNREHDNIYFQDFEGIGYIYISNPSFPSEPFYIYDYYEKNQSYLEMDDYFKKHILDNSSKNIPEFNGSVFALTLGEHYEDIIFKKRMGESFNPFSIHEFLSVLKYLIELQPQGEKGILSVPVDQESWSHSGNIFYVINNENNLITVYLKYTEVKEGFIFPKYKRHWAVSCMRYNNEPWSWLRHKKIITKECKNVT